MAKRGRGGAIAAVTASGRERFLYLIQEYEPFTFPMGSHAALELASRGRRVLGLDRYRPPHTLGSTHGRTRIIREAYFEELAARADLLFDLLAEVRSDNAKGEYYLTDVVALARGRGLSAA